MEFRELTDSNSCLDVHILALGTRPSSSPLSPRRPTSWVELTAPPPPLGRSSTARPALRAGAHRAARFTGRRKEEAARRTGGRRGRAPAVRKSRGAGREEE